MQDLTNFNERTTDLQIRNTLFMPLTLFYDFHGITQHGSFPLDGLKKKSRKQTKQNPIGVNPTFSHLIFSLNNFSGKRNSLLHTKPFYRNCSELSCSYLQVVFLEVKTESLVQKMRGFCLAFSSLQIRFLLTMMQL